MTKTARTTLAAARKGEWQAAEAAAPSALEAYWAGSAWASVKRDVRAGRVTTLRAGRKAR